MLSSEADIEGPPMVLFRFVTGTFPVCCVYSAFCFAIAAAASGNMELMVLGSRPELRLAPGDGGGFPKPNEFREPSMLSLLMASLMRADIGSTRLLVCDYQASETNVRTLLAKVGWRQDTR